MLAWDPLCEVTDPPAPLPPDRIPRIPGCPRWDPLCKVIDPPAPLPGNCGINPYAPPCNLPCLNPDNPYCIDDITRALQITSTANVTITIEENQTQDVEVLNGNPNEIESALFNYTRIPQLTDIERTQILNQIDDFVHDTISRQLPGSFDTKYETKYGPTTDSQGNTIYRGTVIVEVNLTLLPAMVRPTY